MARFRSGVMFVIIIGAVFYFFAFFIPYYLSSSYSTSLEGSSANAGASGVEKILITHVDTPEQLKAIYMTACVASNKNWRENLKKIIDTTELNAVVIDIKDYTGVISFENDFPQSDGGRGCVVPDMPEFIQALHESGIYVIGRISTFQDLSYVKLYPELAVKRRSDGEVWKDYKGLTFIDVGAKPYWEFIVALSKKSHDIGFDEINYDYVRYPSDGNMQDTSYTWTVGTSTKVAMLENFFSYLYENLRTYNLKTSVDLFGMTTTVETDMNIGQILENAFPYFDYVAPMVYPSHYPKTWNGFSNPAEHPYEVVKIAITKAVEREQVWRVSNNLATSTTSKLRPWLQDFDLGANYDAEKVRAQIRATYDSGLDNWMLWDAGNKYTREALLSQ